MYSGVFRILWSFLILKKNQDGYFFKTQRGMISIKTVHQEVSTEYDRMERRFFQHCTSGSHYPSTFNRVSKEVFDCFGFALFTLNSHGPLVLFSSYLIRCCDFFCDDFTNLDRNALSVGRVFMLYLNAIILW